MSPPIEYTKIKKVAVGIYSPLDRLTVWMGWDEIRNDLNDSKRGFVVGF